MAPRDSHVDRRARSRTPCGGGTERGQHRLTNRDPATGEARFCRRGHQLTQDTEYVYPNGRKRQCRVCKNRSAASEKGRAKRARYNASEKGLAAVVRYRATLRGAQTRWRARARERESALAMQR